MSDAKRTNAGPERFDHKGRRVLRTLYCPTPYCYGSQDVVEEPKAEGGTIGVGGCRCGWFVDEEDFDQWLEDQEAMRRGR